MTEAQDPARCLSMMSTDRSQEPFESYEVAMKAVLEATDDSELSLRLLASLLRAEQRAERAEAEVSVDVLTQTASRRLWERVLVLEEARCARSGHPACVIAVDLDGLKAVNDTLGHQAGDELLRTTGTALRSATRATDVVARVGGDEFAVLAVDTDLVTGRVLVARLADALAAAGVRASLGLSERDAEAGLAAAWTQADRRMYTTKRRRMAQLMTPEDASARTSTPSATR